MTVLPMTDEELTQLVVHLGFATAKAINGSAAMGHTLVSSTLRHYTQPPEYPPGDWSEAARAVVREMVLGEVPRLIMDRHPWVPWIARPLPWGTGGQE